MNIKEFYFFNQIFNKKPKERNKFQFGKYSDRNKNLSQLRYWQQGITLFKEKKYLEAAANFFAFVKDPQIDNLNYSIDKEKIDFDFFQGSKQIRGYYTESELYAYANIAEYEILETSIAEKLLQINYSLKFSKFSIEKNKIICELRLESKYNNLTTMYYALREIAIISDQYDDILISQSANLHRVNTSHIMPLPEAEINLKLQFFKKWNYELLDLLKKLDVSKFAGARSFLILAHTFKIYYLLSPEGFLLEELKNIYSIFIKDNSKNNIEGNAEILAEIINLQNLSDETIKESLYYVYSTFPVVLPTNAAEVIKFAKNEIDKIHWYEDNSYKDVAIAVTEYIIGYINFNFGIEPVLEELLHIFWQIMYSDFFEKLGIKKIPLEKNNKISYFLLNQKFNTINIVAKKQYPNFNFNIKHLNLTNKQEFAKSFIYELINLNLRTHSSEK